MKEQMIYSEKLGKMILVSDLPLADELKIIMDDSSASLVGWTHNGWNNDNGGAGW